ncbi:hypothetical protein Tco_1281294 [Tanacetum coccineum]
MSQATDVVSKTLGSRVQLSKDQLAILADTRERIDFWPMCFQHDNMHSSKQMELSYGSDALVEVHNSDNVDNNMINQGVQVIPSSEQSSVMNNSETEITSDSNIIPYSQYVKDSQQAAVQNSNHLSHPRTTDALDIYLNSSPSCRPTKVEVPKELPKVSMVNMSLKILKHHLSGFDVVVKERTTATTITEGSWGFEHTKACFRDEIILFVKALKDLFNTFDQYLIDELSEVQNVFHQMEQAVEQHRLESKIFEVKMDNSVSNQSAPNFDQYFELNELKAQSKKDLVITALKDELRKLKGKDLADNVVTKHNIALEMLKIDVEPIAPRLLNNRTAHSDYLRHTQEQAAIFGK